MILKFENFAQAWARAVRVDGTVIILHSGSHEFVCVRHRKTQTLYISDLIEPSTCKDPGYVGLHVGIYIAAIQDAIDRKKQSLSLSPLPDEGKDSAGTSNDKDDRDDPRGSKDGSGGRRRPKTRNATIKVCSSESCHPPVNEPDHKYRTQYRR